MKTQGVELETSTWEGISDTVSGVGDFFGDIFTAGKWVGIGLGVVILGGIGFAAYSIIKNPKGAAKTAAMFTPAGRAAKLSGRI